MRLFFLLHDPLCVVDTGESEVGRDLAIGEPGSNFLLEDLELVLHLRVDVASRVGQDSARESIANLVSISCECRLLGLRLNPLLLFGLEGSIAARGGLSVPTKARATFTSPRVRCRAYLGRGLV